MTRKKLIDYSFFVVISSIILALGSCKDDDNNNEKLDPSKSVIISSFSPESGGIGTRLILEGENFGNDPSKIKIKVGGIETSVISANGKYIYVVVPGKAFEGTIEATFLDENGKEVTKITAPTKFNYERKMIVSTLLGYVDPKGKWSEYDGSFEDCGGIQRGSWLTFDPLNRNHLYLLSDGGSFRLVDFENKIVKTKIGNGSQGVSRMRTMTWTLNNELIIATDKNKGEQSNTIITRESDFTATEVLVRSKQCNGSAIHPINGELYYNDFGPGTVYRYDFATDKSEELFTIQDVNWEFHIIPHPTGKYAYIVVLGQHYILRTDYDFEKKTFTNPYVVCGWPQSWGYLDGVGTRARLNSPYQGVFVKNDTYVKNNEEDEYDFYFCDRGNHAIRTLSPTGKVTTFAGRGSVNVNSNAHGYIDGDLRIDARFNQPEGLAYDPVDKVFYIGDKENHRIRKIAFEEDK